MGCGSWTPRDWDNYSKSSIAGKSAAGIYTSKMMKAEFDPKDIPVRESRDSADHPSSNAIIIGLDVTGSMSDILEGVAKKLNVLVSEILDRKPVTDPQIMFNAIGDAMCDTTPFQATQFESDIRIAEQLTQLYFERGGGGNGFESYPLAWYFAAEKIISEGWFSKELYDECTNLIEDGYTILFKDVGYGDETLHSMLKEIGDKGVGIKILDSD